MKYKSSGLVAVTALLTALIVGIPSSTASPQVQIKDAGSGQVNTWSDKANEVWADAGTTSQGALVAWKPALSIPASWKITKPSQLKLTVTKGLSCKTGKWSTTRVSGKSLYTKANFTCSMTAQSSGKVTKIVQLTKATNSRLWVKTWWTYTVTAPKAPAVRTPGSAASYAFLAYQSLAPKAAVQWNPCQVVNVRVNLNGAPAGELSLVKEAMNRISQASGLNLNYAGSTTFIPTKAKSLDNEPGVDISVSLAAAGTGAGHSDILPGGGVVGWGGFSSQGFTWMKITKGYVVVDKAALALSATTSGMREALYMHELGHAVGMSHVNDKYQILYPSLSTQQLPASWGAGDKTGLKALGTGPCLSAPTAPENLAVTPSAGGLTVTWDTSKYLLADTLITVYGSNGAQVSQVSSGTKANAILSLGTGTWKIGVKFKGRFGDSPESLTTIDIPSAA